MEVGPIQTPDVDGPPVDEAPDIPELPDPPTALAFAELDVGADVVPRLLAELTVRVDPVDPEEPLEETPLEDGLDEPVVP
jgi:hypothetical protein